MGFVANLIGGMAGVPDELKPKTAPIIDAATTEQALGSTDTANDAIRQQQAFVNALQAQGSQGMGSQAALTGMLMNQAQGNGPSPAQAQLQQATAANTANTAALMAGQRGASQNAGMIARQAGQAGAQAQQQSAGQAATLGAQQALAAQGQLQGLAATQVGQQAQGLGQLNQSAQNEQANLFNQIQSQQNAINQTQANVNNINAGYGQNQQRAVSSAVQGVAGAAGAVLGLAEGGAVHPFVAGWAKTRMAKGGSVPPHRAPVVGEQLAAKGLQVPGHAKVAGDSYANDTVPAMLSPGEVIIPRHIMQGPNPIQESAKFVANVIAKHRGQRSS